MRKLLVLLFLPLIQACTSDEKNTGQTEIMKWKDGKLAAISITYDDATINQFRQALPIMDSLGIKGTFYINTADIPGSEFPPKFIGRPVDEILHESATIPVNESNLFERASLLRFLDIPNAVERHNSAGAAFESDKKQEAMKIVDNAFAEARRSKAGVKRPVLLTGEIITWPELKQFAANGHEFGSHTISHPRLAVLDEKNMLYELEKCREEILNQLGPEHTFSAECPFGTEDERVMKYALDIHPALRNRMPESFLRELNRGNKTWPGEYKKEYIQWQRGPLTATPMNLMKSWVDTLLVHDNVWLVLTFHGVDGIGWEPKPHTEHAEFFGYMKHHENNLWIATFRDVTKYMRERMNGKAEVIETGDKIVLHLTHSLNKDLYDHPLTLRTQIPASWKSVVITQGDSRVKASPLTLDGNSYVQFNADPNADDIVLSQETPSEAVSLQ